MENSPESRAEVRRIEREGGRICNLHQGARLALVVGEGRGAQTSPLEEESVPHTHPAAKPQKARETRLSNKETGASFPTSSLPSAPPHFFFFLFYLQIGISKYLKKI